MKTFLAYLSVGFLAVAIVLWLCDQFPGVFVAFVAAAVSILISAAWPVKSKSQDDPDVDVERIVQEERAKRGRL
jgi:nitrogen fixation-related uncharacterized protein